MATMMTEFASNSGFYSSNSSISESDSPLTTRRVRRTSSRISVSYNELPTAKLDIRGDATLCFDELGTRFEGVIVAEDKCNYTIQGKKTSRRKADEGVPSTCGCLETTLEEDSDDATDGVPVSFDIRIKDHETPMEYQLRRVHGRNGQVCKLTCSNIHFESVLVHRGHKADLIAQQCLGHKIEGGRSQVFCGPISVSAEAREEPRHWVL